MGPNEADFQKKPTRYVDAATYKGTWDTFGMEGIGYYVLPTDAVFEGELRDGTFHGHGSMYWPWGQRIDGVWLRGQIKQKRYIFEDGLIFRDDWKYCQFPDRRFQECIKYGLRPAGATLHATARQGLAIPPMCYDSGNGIFDPRTRFIASYRDPRNVIKVPTAVHAQWIERNCRKARSIPTGIRVRLYQNWSSRKIHPSSIFPPPSLPFSKNSFEHWWKRLSAFDRCNTVEKFESPFEPDANTIRD